MSSIFWYQPAIINADDIISYNGVIQQNNNERTSYFRQLNYIADKRIGKKKPWCGKVDRYFFIKGHLDGVDEKGRKLSFMFTSDEVDYKAALEKELVTIGYKLDSSTEECLVSKKNASSIKYLILVAKKNASSIKYIIIAIAIIATLIIIFNLFKYLQNVNQ